MAWNILLPHAIHFHNRVYVLLKTPRCERTESIRGGQSKMFKTEKMLVKSKTKEGKLRRKMRNTFS